MTSFFRQKPFTNFVYQKCVSGTPQPAGMRMSATCCTTGTGCGCWAICCAGLKKVPHDTSALCESCGWGNCAGYLEIRTPCDLHVTLASPIAYFGSICYFVLGFPYVLAETLGWELIYEDSANKVFGSIVKSEGECGHDSADPCKVAGTLPDGRDAGHGDGSTCPDITITAGMGYDTGCF